MSFSDPQQYTYSPPFPLSITLTTLAHSSLHSIDTTPYANTPYATLPPIYAFDAEVDVGLSSWHLPPLEHLLVPKQSHQESAERQHTSPPMLRTPLVNYPSVPTLVTQQKKRNRSIFLYAGCITFTVRENILIPPVPSYKMYWQAGQAGWYESRGETCHRCRSWCC